MLGYRSFGLKNTSEDDGIINSAKRRKIGYVVWRAKKVRLAGFDCEMFETGDKSFGFRSLFIPLTAEFRTVRKYVLSEKNTLDTLMFSFMEVRRLFEADPRALFVTISSARANLVSTGVPVLVCSDATTMGELVPPTAVEGLLSILYSRPDPLGISTIKEAYTKLDVVTLH